MYLAGRLCPANVLNSLGSPSYLQTLKPELVFIKIAEFNISIHGYVRCYDSKQKTWVSLYSTAVATASWSTFEGTLKLLHTQ